MEIEVCTRYFIYFSYEGSNYHGWQKQPNATSVQETMERCISLMLGEAVELTGAGRTDAGVHARMMVAHFDAKKNISDIPFFIKKINSFLPKDIAVSQLKETKPKSHARFDATSRTYHYFVNTTKNPFAMNTSWYVQGNIDFNEMNRVAKNLFKYTDFTSFSKLHTDVKTNNCKIMQAHWDEMSDGTMRFTIQADRFLRNMVRAVVGTLIEVGRGKITEKDFCDIIEQKNRCSAGSSAPAHALYLVDVTYPEDIF